MANSLQNQQAINQALQQQLNLMQQINGMSGQSGLSSQLAAAASAASDAQDEIQNLANQVMGVNQQIGQTAPIAQSMSSQVHAAWVQAGGGVAGFTAGIRQALIQIPLIGTAAVGTFDMVSDAISGTLEVAQSTGSTLSQIFSSAFNLAKSIFSIEGTIVSGLIGMSNEFAQAASEYRQALEDLRKQLGDFSQNPAANVITSMREMSGELANTGLSVWRVFGNNAEQLKWFTELATGMGPAWDIFGTEIANSAEVIGTFAKGMGLGAEEMANFAGLAISTGSNLTSVLQEAANYSLQLGPTFGLSAKVVSRDVGKMVGNVKVFGNMTVKEMTESAIYTRKLGLEMDKIVGVVDKFDNFETAAESASQLSQAFGLNIDAMKMMQEQDPAKRIDMIRQAMQQAGKSTENMSRQELALLASQTGLDEAAARQAFSMKNVGMSYSEISAAGDDAEASQLTQAEATQQLAGAIEQLVKTGQTFTSFWEALVQGFTDGIVKFGPMRSLMYEIHRALQNVYWAGVKMGRAFAELFPGISEGIQGLHVYFSAFNELIQPLTDKFINFMKTLQGLDPSKIKGATIDFLTGIKDDVDSFFNTQNKGRSMFLQGMMKAIQTLIAMLPGAFQLLITNLRTQILKLPSFIKGMLASTGKSIAADGSQTLSGSFTEMIGTAFAAIKDIGGMFIDLFSDPAVQAALSEAASILWNKFVEVTGPYLATAWEMIKGLALSAASAALSWVADMAWQGFLSAIKLAFQAGTELLIAAFTAPFKLAWAGIQAIVNPSSGTALAADLLSGLASGLTTIGEVLKQPFIAALDGVKAALGINSPSTVFAEIGSNLVAGIGNGLANAASVVTAPFQGAADAVSSILSGSGEGPDQAVSGMQERVAAMEDLSMRLTTLKAGFSTDIAAVIDEMVKQANDLDAAMSTVGDVTISTGLEKVATALGVDNKRFTIENKGLNINVNLTVTMDAKQLATELTQKNLLDDNKSIQVG